MALFTYKAMTADATEVAGSIAADTPRNARDLLRGRGLTISEIVEVAAARRWLASWRRRRMAAPRMTEVYREWLTLLRAGIPLLQALDVSTRQSRGTVRATILQVRDDIASGLGLGESMRRQPDVFDDLSVKLIHAGEQAGALEDVLDRLIQYRQRSRSFRGKVSNALIYPGVVFTMAIVVSVLLMRFVVPSILEPLIRSGRPLPGVTRVVKGASDLIVSQGWLLLAGGVLLATITALLARTDRGELIWHKVQLRLPVAGELVRKQLLARLVSILAVLLRSGIPFIQALEIASGLVRNRVIREALGHCRAAVESGQDIAPGLERSGAFPPLVVQLFAVGQQSGRLEEMLDQLAEEYDQQVQAAAQRLTSMLEPVMILFLAVMVGLIAFATILPILEAGHVL
jgi:type II secretory pathway component PulF